MKKRVSKKRDKQLTSFALACERIANTVVEKVSNALALQKKLDEHERFLGDLLIMLCKREPQCVLEHDVCEGKWIWNEVCKLIEENKELAQNLKEKV